MSPYYDPSLSLFLSSDPVNDMMSGWSPYHYAFNNPIRFVDVDGLYGSESEAIKQQQNANARGFSTGDIYQSGDEWGFNVIQGENSFGAFERDFGTEPNYPQIRQSINAHLPSHDYISDARTFAVNMTGIGATFASDAFNSMSSVSSMGNSSYGTGAFEANNGRYYSGKQIINGFRPSKTQFVEATIEGKNFLPNQSRIAGLKGTAALGVGMTALSYGMTLHQYNTGQISKLQYRMEMAVTTISAIPNIYTLAFGFGWEVGRAITNIPAYRRVVHPYEFSQIVRPK